MRQLAQLQVALCCGVPGFLLLNCSLDRLRFTCLHFCVFDSFKTDSHRPPRLMLSPSSSDVDEWFRCSDFCSFDPHVFTYSHIDYDLDNHDVYATLWCINLTLFLIWKIMYNCAQPWCINLLSYYAPPWHINLSWCWSGEWWSIYVQHSCIHISWLWCWIS